MKRVLQVIPAYRFTERDFVGGDPALDFINTVAGRDQPSPRDRIDGYERLLDWAAHANLLPGKLLRSLAQKAHREPVAAANALTRAKALRESLFAIVSAIAAGRTPPKDALALLREHWLEGAKAQALRFNEGRINLEIENEAPGLDLVASAVAWRLVEQLQMVPAERFRICKGTDCAWLFIDRSKAGRRRWCDMAVCGNVAKSRRFYERVRAGR